MKTRAVRKQQLVCVEQYHTVMTRTTLRNSCSSSSNFLSLQRTIPRVWDSHVGLVRYACSSARFGVNATRREQTYPSSSSTFYCYPAPCRREHRALKQNWLQQSVFLHIYTRCRAARSSTLLASSHSHATVHLPPRRDDQAVPWLQLLL